jgi:hypothetical protein
MMPHHTEFVKIVSTSPPDLHVLSSSEAAADELHRERG